MNYRVPHAVLLLTTLASAPAASPATQPGSRPASQPVAAPVAAARPHYRLVRYEEDWRALDLMPADAPREFFDPIKNIRLDDDWRLTLGGSARIRMEAKTNEFFGAREPSQDTYYLQQYLLHANLRYRDTFRFFLEGIDARVNDRDLVKNQNMENQFDINQLFIDHRPFGDDTPLLLRGGRHEMSFGNGRQVWPRNWGNAKRRFDAAHVIYEDAALTLDFFYARPIRESFTENLNRRIDRIREEEHFYGVYSTWRYVEHHQLEFYFLGLEDSGDRVNANGQAGDQSIYTWGARAAGRDHNVDYEGELAGQWGFFAGDPVRAALAATDAGYTFSDVPTEPRIGLGMEYRSGDKDVTDNIHQTYVNLFGVQHRLLGLIDTVGRQNVWSTHADLSFKPIERTTVILSWLVFWNDSTRDAVVDDAGNVQRIVEGGFSGHDLGHEFDLAITYDLDEHSSFLLGYSHFWPGDYFKSSGFGEDADFYYAQYQLRF